MAALDRQMRSERMKTELQHGSFFLTVDGDLFKVDLVFPESR